jgi:hypothetical protein
MEHLISTIAFGTSVIGCTMWKKQRYGYVLEYSNDENQMKQTQHSDLLSSSSIPSKSSRLIRHLSTNSKWSDYSEDDETFIQDFPKIELHVVRQFYCDLLFAYS